MDNRTYTMLGIQPALEDTPIVSVVGAGGKTTLIFQIADEISADGHGDVIICGPTRFTRKNHSYSVISYADWMDSRTSPVAVSGVANRTVVLSGTLPADSKGRYSSINDDQIAKLANDPSVAAVIVNADGSRMKPFKAPKPGEPVLASGTSHVLGLIGADSLGIRIDSDKVHRPEEVRRFAELVGLDELELLDQHAIAEIFYAAYRTSLSDKSIKFAVAVHKADYAAAASKIVSSLDDIRARTGDKFPTVLTSLVGGEFRALPLE